MSCVSQHIEHVKKKCTRASSIIKFLCGTSWGSHPDTLVTLYKTFVRFIINYGSFIYLPKQKNNIETLEKIQISALRSALGYRTSTPKNVIITELKIHFIEQRTQFLCRCYLTKVLTNDNLAVCDAIREFRNNSKKKKKHNKNKTV